LPEEVEEEEFLGGEIGAEVPASAARGGISSAAFSPKYFERQEIS
jgi:hypothetical protein